MVHAVDTKTETLLCPLRIIWITLERSCYVSRKTYPIYHGHREDNSDSTTASPKSNSISDKHQQ